MIPKAHHRQYYTQAEEARKRFTKYQVTGEEYHLFVALKGIRKSSGSRDSLHFFFGKVKRYLGCSEFTESSEVDSYVKSLERMNPGELDHLPPDLDFLYEKHPWKYKFKSD